MTENFNKGDKRYCPDCKRVISRGKQWRRHKGLGREGEGRCGASAKTKQFNQSLKRGMGREAYNRATPRNVMQYLQSLQRKNPSPPKKDEEKKEDKEITESS